MTNRKKYIPIAAGIMLAALIFGCKRIYDNGVKDGAIDVRLSDNQIDWQEIFDSIRVIPLETSDNVLLTGVGRTVIWDSDIYILNRDKVHRFDSCGNFKNTIGRIGQGPGEYRYAYDFDLNPESGNIFILSPFGVAYEFTPDGTFIASYELPIQPNYQRLRRMKDGRWMSWTTCYYGEQPITILNDNLSEAILNPKVNFHMVNLLWATPHFMSYNSELYMSPQFDQTVYKITSDTIMAAFAWDFGEGQNLSEQALAKYDISPSTDSNENWELTVAFFKDTDLIHSLSSPWINSKYIFQKVIKNVEVDDNFRPKSNPKVYYIFHNRYSAENIVVSQFGPGLLTGNIIYMNDNYVLERIPWGKCELYEEFLPEGMTLADINPDDDNPMLVKYYFKK